MFDTEVGKKYGGQALWHHLDCFVKVRDELGYFSGGEVLPGFKDLSPEDKKTVKDTVKAVKVSDIPAPKKIKLEKTEKEEDEKENKLMKAQDKQFFTYKEKLRGLKKTDWATILEHNGQQVPQGPDNVSYKQSHPEYSSHLIFILPPLFPPDSGPPLRLSHLRLPHPLPGVWWPVHVQQQGLQLHRSRRLVHLRVHDQRAETSGH